MNALEYIRIQITSARSLIDMTLENMTDELFNWAPSGTANTISATFVHFVNVEDNFINKILSDSESVWERGNWSEKTGIQKPPSIGEDWSEFKHRQVDLQPLLDYKEAVWAATDEYLATLTAEELERKITFAGRERTVAGILALAVTQALGHIGEIAALKGIQGAKGLPI